MPLVPATLKQKLDLFMGDNPPKYPETGIELGLLWSDAIDTYTQTIFPVVNPAMRLQARETLSKSLIPLASPDPIGVNFPVIMSTAFLTYAITLGLGMQPSFTSTPPPAPLGPLLAGGVIPQGLSGAPASLITTSISSIIDGWFRTSIAVNNASGVSAPWT